MGHAVIRYTIRAESLEENRALVRDVFRELAAAAPADLAYLVLELDNGDFVHVVSENEGRSPLLDLAAFRAFTDRHADRRVGALSRSPARIVGNYRMMASSNRERE